MEIRMKTLMAGVSGVRQPGEVATVSAEEGEMLVEGGYAEAIDAAAKAGVKLKRGADKAAEAKRQAEEEAARAEAERKAVAEAAAASGVKPVADAVGDGNPVTDGEGNTGAGTETK